MAAAQARPSTETTAPRYDRILPVRELCGYTLAFDVTGRRAVTLFAKVLAGPGRRAISQQLLKPSVRQGRQYQPPAKPVRQLRENLVVATGFKGVLADDPREICSSR